MGLFHWKKKAPQPFDPLLETLNCLQKALSHSEIRDSCVHLPTEQLTIRPDVNQVSEQSAALYFEVSHPDLAAPFFDQSAGLGQTPADAIQKAVTSFLSCGLCSVRHCVQKEYVRALSSTFHGVEKQWDVSESGIASLVGDDPAPLHPPEDGYWRFIAEKLPAHLGNHKHYFVKVYASKQPDGSVLCECRVNNTLSAELTYAITQYAQSWAASATLTSDKQFFVLTQRAETITPYPFTRAQIFRFTDQAIALFAAADTKEKDDMLVAAFAKITKDSSLATELYSFLPEICAQHAFCEATYGEQIVFHTGKQQSTVYLDQLASYRWMQQRAIDGFSQGRFDNEAFKRLVYSSATCNVLSAALKKGSQLEDIVLTSLSFTVPEAYQIR